MSKRLSTPRGTKAAVAFLQKFPDNLMIVDESTTIKNRKATRTKNIVRLSRLCEIQAHPDRLTDHQKPDGPVQSVRFPVPECVGF
jgi:hypothetical protein